MIINVYAFFALIFFYFKMAEVNVLWGAHQVHHSSEDYNLSTALRQSVIQNYTSWVRNLFYFGKLSFLLFIAGKWINAIYYTTKWTDFISVYRIKVLRLHFICRED